MSYKFINIQSSYKENNLGKTLYETVLKIKPKKIMEFGVLHGYSTIAMAQALRDLGGGHIFAYDLFEDYPYNHGTVKEVARNLKKYGVEDFVSIKRGNFFNWLGKWEKFDLLHIDISNDGEIITQAVKKLSKFLDLGSVILFEGGIKARDRIDWMTKYKKPPMYPLKQKLGYEILNEGFPGLSIIKRTLQYAKK